MSPVVVVYQAPDVGIGSTPEVFGPFSNVDVADLWIQVRQGIYSPASEARGEPRAETWNGGQPTWKGAFLITSMEAP